MKPPRVAPFPSETALSTACQKRIRVEWAGEVVKVHGSASQKAGTPDLLACVRGRFVAVELKQPGKKPTPLQMKRLRDWAAVGALAGWATTEVELDALLEHVGDVGWVNPQLA
jgi:hypothetical protein